MPTTRRKRSPPVAKPGPGPGDALWEDTRRYATKARAYTDRGEWLGAYYTTLLAAVACKHCVDARTGHATDEGGRTATHTATASASASSAASASAASAAATASSATTTGLFVEDQPRATLALLYAAVPYYRRKVERFQAAFACPNVRDADADAGGGGDQGRDDEAGVDADCDRVPVVDLTQVEALRFDDLVGNDLATATIRDTLVYPVRMPRLYPNLARALLFYGPPGTGKTLLAKATAHELNVDPTVLRVLFFAPTGDAFKGKYVGETEANIVRLFRCASQKATALETKLATAGKPVGPRVLSVLFVDEIDSIARRRDAQSGEGGGAVANATNTLLQMMDGIQSFDNVVVMAATNYPWNLDTAVLRRFGQQVHVPLPDEAGVRAFLEHAVVGQLKATLFATAVPSYFQRHRTVAECFDRWAPLHGLTREQLAVLASEMTTTTKRPGYAPRDIARMCDLAFTREAQRASSDAFFLVRRRRHGSKGKRKQPGGEAAKAVGAAAKAVGEAAKAVGEAAKAVGAAAGAAVDAADAADVPDLVSSSSSSSSSTSSSSTDTPWVALADELFRALEGTHVSRTTFAALRAVCGDALDAAVPPTYLDRPPFPTALDVTRDGKTAVYTHVDANTDAKHCHVYEHAGERVLFRTVTVRARHQTHTVPLYAWATTDATAVKAVVAATHTLWFVFDDATYAVPVAKGALVVEAWTTAHPEPWTTDTATSWLASLTGKATGTAVGADAVTSVAQLFARKVTGPVPSTTDTATSRSETGDAARCAHVTYNVQTLIAARSEVRPSAKLENLRSLATYQRTGEA